MEKDGNSRQKSSYRPWLAPQLRQVQSGKVAVSLAFLLVTIISPRNPQFWRVILPKMTVTPQAIRDSQIRHRR
jgi:hypothetical protein